MLNSCYLHDKLASPTNIPRRTTNIINFRGMQFAKRSADNWQQSVPIGTADGLHYASSATQCARACTCLNPPTAPAWNLHSGDACFVSRSRHLLSSVVSHSPSGQIPGYLKLIRVHSLHAQPSTRTCVTWATETVDKYTSCTFLQPRSY